MKQQNAGRKRTLVVQEERPAGNGVRGRFPAGLCALANQNPDEILNFIDLLRKD